MQRLKNYLFNACLFLNCLLVFLLLVESRIAVPAWLKVMGRTHPMLLHFPLVLLILYVIAVVYLQFRKAPDPAYQQMADGLLLLAAFSAAFTALAGFFLGKEEGYDATALQWHQWGGVAVSVLSFGWYAFRKTLRSNKITALLSSLSVLALVIFTGHQGAEITHGQNFLLAPVMPEKTKPLVAIEEARVYADMVRPILEAKCMSCHNSKKAKGELVMETEALLLKGGKNGILWDSAATDLGLLLRRVHLPLDQKKHMPPQGKPQLTEEEIEILTQWIRKGADFRLKVADLPATDTLQAIAQKLFSEAEMAEYDFEEADASVIEQLNTTNFVVRPQSTGSPALQVQFFNPQLFNADQLSALSKIKKQVVSLDLSHMPLKDADLEIIGQLENLRRLNLNFTGITGKTFAELKRLRSLKVLSLAGTPVKAEQLKELKMLPQLKLVYAWNTAVTAAELQKLTQELKPTRFEGGFKGDTMVLKLSPPVVQNEEMILLSPVPLQLKHYINGAVIRFTTDGTDPDSLHSTIYKPGEMINGNLLVKAKAYKPGWISSDIMEINFYKSSFRPDSIRFLLPPDPAYTGEPKMLTDLLKGETNFRLGNWLGWRQTKMETLLHFAQPTTLQSITFSTLVDIVSYIMPPVGIEVWGGDHPGKLKLLGRSSPKQPTMTEPAFLRGYECRFSPATVRYIKIIGSPVSKLPAWHPGKGDKGWIFVDEVLVN